MENQIKVQPYQIACMQALSNYIELGNKKLFIQMPTGSGKTFTILQFFKSQIKSEDKVLYLVGIEQVKQQIEHRCKEMLLSGCIDVDTLQSMIKKKGESIYNYIVIELDCLLYDDGYQALVARLYKEYEGTIIGIFSLTDERTKSFIEMNGIMAYSLSLADAIYDFSNVEHNIQDNTDMKHDLTIENSTFQLIDILDDPLKKVIIKKIICELICKYKENSREVTNDIISVIAGFIPFGNLISIGVKYLYKSIANYIRNHLEDDLGCSECITRIEY